MMNVFYRLRRKSWEYLPETIFSDKNIVSNQQECTLIYAGYFFIIQVLVYFFCCDENDNDRKVLNKSGCGCGYCCRSLLVQYVCNVWRKNSKTRSEKKIPKIKRNVTIKNRCSCIWKINLRGTYLRRKYLVIGRWTAELGRSIPTRTKSLPWSSWCSTST